jgi:hypothetical protein
MVTRKRSHQRSQRSHQRSQSQIVRLSSYGQRQASMMESLIRKGPATIILVFSTTCPHCHTYMPIWKKLCKTKGRQTNMVSMESSTYNQTPLSQKLPVSGVPSVLYVGPDGQPTEIQNPRDEPNMKNVIKSSTNSEPKPMSQPISKPVSQPVSGPMDTSMTPRTVSSSSPMYTTSSNVRMTNSPLKPLPAVGGSWDMLFNQALPAAALLGAYAAFPMQRSSGLGPVRTTRRRRS